MTKIKERTCEACMGTGYPVVLQPVQPGRKIYPVECMPAKARERLWTLPHLWEISNEE